MTTTTVSAEICQFIQNNLVAEGVTIEGNTALAKIGLDSFSIIEIVLFIERKYGVQLPDEALVPENIASPDAFAKCVLKFLKR